MEPLRLIAFEVTRRCRFNCRHCRASAVRVDENGELTTEQCKRMLAAVADFSRCVIIFTGGEPAERDDIYELIRYALALGLRPVLATCGYTINDESIARLKEAGILALSISLDGATARSHDAFRQTDGAFDFALRAAELARRTGIRFQINTTISKINVAEVGAITELAEKLGAYCFNPFILVPTGRGRTITEEILEPGQYERLLGELLEIKLNSAIEVRVTCGPAFARICREEGLNTDISGCMGGRGFGFISYRGDVQICGFLNISAGNLIENDFDFAQIWQGSEFLKEIRNLSSYKGDCGICQYVGLCGGCRARAYGMTGDYLAADPICKLVARDS